MFSGADTGGNFRWKHFNYLFFFLKLIKRVEAKIFLGDLSIINVPIVNTI